MKTLGETIKERRIELGMSQRELANLTKLSNATISRLENDNDTIISDSNTLKIVAECLRIDYYYLLCLNGQIDDSKELRMIRRAFAYLNEIQKQTILSQIKDMDPESFEVATLDIFKVDDEQ